MAMLREVVGQLGDRDVGDPNVGQVVDSQRHGRVRGVTLDGAGPLLRVQKGRGSKGLADRVRYGFVRGNVN